jgi:O-antigen ligase
MSAIGVLMTMSRTWIAALMIVVLVHIFRIRSTRYKIKAVIVLIALASLAIPVAMQLGVVDMFAANDSYTQSSNTTRLRYLQKLPGWVLEDYPLIGTGPGTQNGPAGVDDKIASDFLWLAIVIDCGAIMGAILVAFRVILIFHVLRRSLRRGGARSGLEPLTSALCVSFLLASFVDSAFAHMVSESVFYVVCGLCLYKNDPTLPRFGSPSTVIGPAQA